jgi:glycerophosphoryl diester phosphodiesterase
VRERSLAELRQLDAGFHTPFRGRGVAVPTLADLLAAHPDVPLNVEIKQDEPSIVASVLATLDRFGARGRTLLAAEHHAIMERIRAEAPDVVTSFSAAEVADFVFRLRDGRLADWRPAGVALQVPPDYEGTPIVTAESVAAAHRFGLEVHVWTINDEGEMERLLDLGVDAVMTDVPARAHALLVRRGLR